MSDKNRIKRMCITAFACLLLGTGIGLCDYAGLGTDPFTVFLVGMQRNIGFTVGTLNLAVCLIMIIFAFFADRSKVSIVTFLATFFTSAGIDLVGLMLRHPVSSAAASCLFLVAGELLYAFGTALAIVPDAGIDPYNAFLSSLQKLSGHSYKTVRWIVEILFLITGYLLGGVVGIGTAVSLAAIAPLVEFFVIRLKKILPL